MIRMDEQKLEGDSVIPLQNYLSSEEIEEIRANISVVHHSKRDIIFRQNSGTSHLKLLRLSHKQLPGRIADVILYFSDINHKNEEFDFPLTWRELAELAGTTKESFIRTLAEFKNDKIIELNGSHVKIKSMKIVRTLSELG